MHQSIRAILFDADGVLIHPYRFRAYLEREHGITPEMTAPFFDNPFSYECLVGRMPLRDALRPYLPWWGWRDTPEAFIAAWLETENAPDERMLSAVKALRQAGYTVCLATSQEPNRAAYMRSRMDFEVLFDRLFISCEMGCQKPEPEYFRRIEAELGLRGEQLLFWDDNPGWVAAARSLGWQAEVFTGYEAFQPHMIRYLE
jgi:putative hydrolase of the HAD superfamily